MREIKLRVWFPGVKRTSDTEISTGIMGLVTNLKGSNVGYIFDGVVAECFVDGRQVFYEAYQNFILMQYTGLKDKKGKEIYESDILRTATDKPMVVGWSDRFASFVIHRDGWAFQHWFGEACNPEDCEVIGNIYENPELLKQ